MNGGKRLRSGSGLVLNGAHFPLPRDPALPSAFLSNAPFLQVRFGQQKRYQDWFQRQYLSTPDSQSLRCDLIRYICGVVHPSNEVLSSDILPRWAIIGWLLTTCTVRGWAVGQRRSGGEGSSSLEFPLFACFFLTVGFLTPAGRSFTFFLLNVPSAFVPCPSVSLQVDCTHYSLRALGLNRSISAFTADPQVQISQASLSFLLAPGTMYGYSSEWILP